MRILTFTFIGLGALILCFASMDTNGARHAVEVERGLLPVENDSKVHLRSVPKNGAASQRIDEHIVRRTGDLDAAASLKPEMRGTEPERARVFGHVRDKQTGRPLEGALLRLTDPFDFAATEAAGQERRAANETLSNSAGFYSLVGSKAGLLELTCQLEGYATHSTRYVELSKEGQQVDVWLDVGHAISGRVIEASGAGLKEVEVKALSVSSSGVGVSDEVGNFRIEGLSSGEFVLEANGPGWSAVLEGVEANSYSNVIQAAGTHSISGRAISAQTGKPLSDFTAAVRRFNAADASYGRPVVVETFVASADGRFGFSGLGGGIYILEVSAPGLATIFTSDFELIAGLSLSGLVVRVGVGASLFGTVYEEEKGQPAAGALVELAENFFTESAFEDSLGFASGLSNRSARTDLNGRFSMSLLTPGAYQLRILRAGKATFVLSDIDLESGDSRDLGRLNLQAMCVIAGRIYDPSGLAKTGASVFLKRLGAAHQYSDQTTSDREGVYRFEVAPGEYEIWATVPPIEKPLGGRSIWRGIISSGSETEQDLELELR